MTVEEIRRKLLEILLDINECNDDEKEYVINKVNELSFEISN